MNVGEEETRGIVALQEIRALKYVVPRIHIRVLTPLFVQGLRGIDGTPGVAGAKGVLVS